MRLTLSVSDVEFLNSLGITTGDEHQAPLDGTQRLMKEMGLPMTRGNYLHVAFLGNVPDELDGEIEAELPDEFQTDLD